MGGEFCCKKTHFSKIILPLLVILILTLVVNMTVTGVLQSTRAALRQIADNEASMDSSEIVKLANDTADSISGSLAKNGLISTMQLLMVVITTIIAFVCITNPLKKIIKQLNELTNRLENNQAGQLKIPSTNIGARQDDLFPVVFHKDEMHRLVQFLSPETDFGKKTDLLFAAINLQACLLERGSGRFKKLLQMNSAAVDRTARSETRYCCIMIESIFVS